MRPSQKSNRSRGKSSRKNVGNNVNRVYESAGPDGKVRGTPQQIIDKYLALARDAQTSGDRVMSENFLQHAEHYQRLLSAAQAASMERREQQANGAQRSAQYDGDDEDEESVTDAPAVSGMATIDTVEQPALVETPEEDKKRASPRPRRSRGARNGAGGGAAAEQSKPAESSDAQDAPAEGLS